MKHVVLHRHFVKQVRKLPDSVKQAFRIRRDLFLEDETNPLLKIHPLQGKYLGYKSFNVNADIRVIYKEIDEDNVLFVAIGSHSELY